MSILHYTYLLTQISDLSCIYTAKCQGDLDSDTQPQQGPRTHIRLVCVWMEEGFGLKPEPEPRLSVDIAREVK